ncbi:5-deoxy-glucuronate isomerase [Gephyromycinifex aptenodytis]|uniref:5-deoxy-glucuronate isomerase n=1 Tax=Gephyromycinifex aptenodytis TaxID=2716227 RepID=UPI001445165A|nr:5-deoxy-glucuronate isomerase [Gephyromycinifex aptenodytis]
MSDWFKPATTSGNAEYHVRIQPGDPGWEHTGLLVADLDRGERRHVDTQGSEYIVVPLACPSAVVEVDGERYELQGRADVFSGPTDVLYVGRDSAFDVEAPEGGRVALCLAPAKEPFPVKHLRKADVPVEMRGAGQASRQVQNFGTPGVLDADSIIACEVITPAGNWSSYPPHKHDEEREGVETALEEIYYFEMQTEAGGGPAKDGNAPDPIGYQRVYGTDERPIDVLAEVRSGDVVLVPHGWHGPAMAPTGYDMYYLNVMAGPGQTRAWLICDDPSHAWVRSTWQDQPVDPRLPYRP